MFPPDETAELQPPKLVATDSLQKESEEEAEDRESDAAPVPVHPPEDTAELDKIDEAANTPWVQGGMIDERYYLERRLGGGAMGEVWLSSDRLLKKSVALKVLRPELAKNRATVRRFLQEVALAQSVTHPNVVRIHDTGEAHGLPYFTMEYLQGQTLDQLVGRHGELPSSDTPPMSLREIRELSIEILGGLEAAHAVGVIHRDLKPANVMLTHRGAILMDFGVAGVEAFPGLAKKASPNPNEARSLIHTAAGTIFGSPAYMAPELWEGASATVHSDLYSFGVMLYQMLTGRLPYDAPNASAFLEKLRTETPVPVKTLRKDTPLRLAAAVTRCMARAPEERPSSAQAVADLVTPLARRRGIVIGAAVTTLGAVAIAATAYQSTPSYEALGLPDAIAEADLHGAVRSWDVGDYESARRQLDRLEARAPRSAAVVFWRATVEKELRDHESRLAHCSGGSWQGSQSWVELADAACGSSYDLGKALLATLGGKAGGLNDAYLPLAVEGSLIPQVEVGLDRSGALTRQAEAVLDRLGDDPDFEDGAYTPVRWGLAEMDLNIALGRLDMARELVNRLLDDYPDAPIAKERAAWLYSHLGERERARVWASEVESIDPRPTLRMTLEEGRLAEAWERVEQLDDGPYSSAALEMWCGYAFRFELPSPPPQCDALGPGLVRTLWGRATGRGTDGATMTPHERTIAAQQAGLNLGDCLDRVDPGPVLTHSAPPFETYLAQLQVSAAVCAHSPSRSDLATARRLAEQLNAVAPGDLWSLLLQAQLESAGGSDSIAQSKRQLVAEAWSDADADLPLVSRLRESLAPPAPEPEPEPFLDDPDAPAEPSEEDLDDPTPAAVEEKAPARRPSKDPGPDESPEPVPEQDEAKPPESDKDEAKEEPPASEASPSQ